MRLVKKFIFHTIFSIRNEVHYYACTLADKKVPVSFPCNETQQKENANGMETDQKP